MSANEYKDINDRTAHAYHILERRAPYDLNLYSGPVEAAQVIFEEILSNCPNSFEALLGLGRCYSYKHFKYREAVRLFERAAGLKPEDPEPYFRAGVVLLRAAERETIAGELYRQSIRFFQKALELGYTPQYELFDSLGTLFFRIEEFTEAISWFMKAAESMPAEGFIPSTFYLAAESHARLGNYAEAIEWYELCKKHWPVDGEAIDQRIEALRAVLNEQSTI